MKESASSRLLRLIQDRHPSLKGWLVIAECPTTTGASRRGEYTRLDALAFAAWPSQGYRLIAYEIKVSRADFMREIQRPIKREPAERMCGECFFVTPPGIVKPEEVPEGWGLLVGTKKGDKLIQKKLYRSITGEDQELQTY